MTSGDSTEHAGRRPAGHERRKHGAQSRIADVVIDAQSFFPLGDQTRPAQPAQMLRNVRLPAAEESGQMANALLAGKERFQQLEAGGMGEQAKNSSRFAVGLWQASTPKQHSKN